MNWSPLFSFHFLKYVQILPTLSTFSSLMNNAELKRKKKITELPYLSFFFLCHHFQQKWLKGIQINKYIRFLGCSCFLQCRYLLDTFLKQVLDQIKSTASRDCPWRGHWSSVLMGHCVCCTWIGQQQMALYICTAHITRVPLSHWVSIIKHKFKDKIVNNFKMVTAHH